MIIDLKGNFGRFRTGFHLISLVPVQEKRTKKIPTVSGRENFHFQVLPRALVNYPYYQAYSRENYYPH